MWHDHPFTYRNKETKKAVGVEVGEWCWIKFEKGGRQYKGGGLHEIDGDRNLLPTMSIFQSH